MGDSLSLTFKEAAAITGEDADRLTAAMCSVCWLAPSDDGRVPLERLVGAKILLDHSKNRLTPQEASMLAAVAVAHCDPEQDRKSLLVWEQGRFLIMWATPKNRQAAQRLKHRTFPLDGLAAELAGKLRRLRGEAH